ncbi:hypothetical protein, partial [Pseudomonas aeruginosa]|nr:hypothetical protein [Pseudomonas aeruginosa]MCS8174939.1 hypothetical protein [Pseudomonas aeruginosa]MCS9531628.1 hypothetical protein [Pseudomonas aeruginosa]MCS9587520.1 hypothetical protein [Pseudomonas aeruginosa]MCS9624521.1 hypothetical protein [Pseudomonas aeruginosa]
QQDAQDAMSDVGLLAQGFVSLASHNIYYVKLNVSFIKTSVFRAPFSSFRGRHSETFGRMRPAY